MRPTGELGTGFFKAASYVLLLALLGHSTGHYLFYINVNSFDDKRRALHDTMAAYITDSTLHTSMWEMLQMFSLTFSLLLAFAAIFNLAVLRAGLDPSAWRSITTLNLIFWLSSLGLFVCLHPVLQPIVISGAASVLYGLSWLKQRQAR